MIPKNGLERISEMVSPEQSENVSRNSAATMKAKYKHVGLLTRPSISFKSQSEFSESNITVYKAAKHVSINMVRPPTAVFTNEEYEETKEAEVYS